MSSSSKPESSSTLSTDETAADCLMLLSKIGEIEIEKVFSCKTCGKKFANFQALGGHRASHKKPKLDLDNGQKHNNTSPPPKPRSHKCSICNAEFALGQALGGHMRRHRDNSIAVSSSATSVKEAQKCDDGTPLKVLQRSNSRRTYMELDLDLNLAPPLRASDFEDRGVSDLRFGLGKFDLGFVGRSNEYDLKRQFGKRRRLLTLDCFV